MPGTRGNVVIVGHHDAWGGPFRHLDQIRARDFIVVQSRDRKSGDFKTFVYRARAVRKVSADGSRALMGRSTDHRLTLVTGRGGRFSSDRLVISAVSGPSTAHAIRAPALHATTRGPSILFNAYVLFALVGPRDRARRVPVSAAPDGHGGDGRRAGTDRRRRSALRLPRPHTAAAAIELTEHGA